jgi:hypothetical protein
MRYVGKYRGQIVFEASASQAVILRRDHAGNYLIARTNEHGRPVLGAVAPEDIDDNLQVAPRHRT